MKGATTEVVYLRGAVVTARPYSTTETAYHQEANFLYLSGYDREKAELVVLLNSTEGHCILFVDPPSQSYAVWNGLPLTLAQIKSLYDVDQAMYKTDMVSTIRSLNLTTVFTLPDTSSVTVFPPNSTAQQAFVNITRDTNRLLGALSLSRQVKTEQELSYMKTASLVSVSAHLTLMRAMKPNMYEYQAQALFEATCADCGLQDQSYPPIMGSGPHSAILHYNFNSRLINGSELLLVDAAGEFRGYCSDITRTFPVNGHFTAAQRQIYNIVLAAQTAAISLIKPNVLFRDLELVAATEIVKGLAAAGLLQNGTVTEYLEAGMQGLFMPHGLGHGVGLNVHDGVGVPTLQAGMVVTVEPGIYFIPALLEPAFNSSAGIYLNQELISQYMYPYDEQQAATFGSFSTTHLEPTAFVYLPSRDAHVVRAYEARSQDGPHGIAPLPPSVAGNRVGGVRIEDVLLVNEDGFEYLSQGLPRTAEEVESVMASRPT